MQNVAPVPTPLTRQSAAHVALHLIAAFAPPPTKVVTGADAVPPITRTRLLRESATKAAPSAARCARPIGVLKSALGPLLASAKPETPNLPASVVMSCRPRVGMMRMAWFCESATSRRPLPASATTSTGAESAAPAEKPSVAPAAS